MKKIYIIFLLLNILFINKIIASNKEEVTLSKCIDGDTAWFNYNNEKIKIRFLGINAPEDTTIKEEYGNISSKYTCDLLTKSNKIEIEFDPKSNKYDKYNRLLAWIFIDNELLQRKLVRNGYAEIKYMYDDYKYKDILIKEEKYAKENKLGIWNNNEEKLTSEIDDNSIYLSIIIIVFISIIVYLTKK